MTRPIFGVCSCSDNGLESGRLARPRRAAHGHGPSYWHFRASTKSLFPDAQEQSGEKSLELLVKPRVLACPRFTRHRRLASFFRPASLGVRIIVDLDQLEAPNWGKDRHGVTS